MTFDGTKKFSGQDGAIYIDGVLCPVVQEFKYQAKRDPIKRDMVGKSAPQSWDGPYEPELSIKINQSAFDLFFAVMTDTPAEGTATVLHAGLTAPGAGTWSVTEMTDTTPGTPSRIRFTAKTAGVTAPGVAIIIGTNANDVRLEETVTIPIMAADAYVTGSKAFKTVDSVTLGDAVAVGGTIEVASVVGTLTATPGPFSKRMTLVAKAVNGDGLRGTLTITNCWPTLHDFSMAGGAKSIMEPTIPFAIADPDNDIEFVQDTV